MGLGEGFHRVGFVGHNHPVDQAHRYQLDGAFLGGAEHQLFEAGETQLLLVEPGHAAHNALLEGGQQGSSSSLPFGPDYFLYLTHHVGKLLPVSTVRPGRAFGSNGGGLRFGLVLRINVNIVENQPVHLVGQAAGCTPRYADNDDTLADGSQRVDDVDEIRVAGYQHISTDVGIGMGALDAVRRHLHVHAVLNPRGPGVHGGRSSQRESGGHVHRFDAGGVEGGRIDDKLAGPS